MPRYLDLWGMIIIEWNKYKNLCSLLLKQTNNTINQPKHNQPSKQRLPPGCTTANLRLRVSTVHSYSKKEPNQESKNYRNSYLCVFEIHSKLESIVIFKSLYACILNTNAQLHKPRSTAMHNQRLMLLNQLSSGQ